VAIHPSAAEEFVLMNPKFIWLFYYLYWIFMSFGK